MLNYKDLELKNDFIFYQGTKMREEIINGYVYVIDNKNLKKYRKHRLIWEIVNNKKIPKNMMINHIDGNKLNNKPSNLEITTAKENTIHWYKNINKNDLSNNFKGKQVYAYHVYMREEMFFETITKASKELGISDKAICSVLAKKQKTTKEYIFSYTKIENIDEYIKNNINLEKLENYKQRAVIAIYPDENIKVFQSVANAAEFFNTRKSNVIRWLNGTKKNKNNITFISY